VKTHCHTGAFAGHSLPPADGFAATRTDFTPATKAATCHDENIYQRRSAYLVGAEQAGRR